MGVIESEHCIQQQGISILLSFPFPCPQALDVAKWQFQWFHQTKTCQEIQQFHHVTKFFSGSWTNFSRNLAQNV